MNDMKEIKFHFLGKPNIEMTRKELEECAIYLANENKRLRKELSEKSLKYMDDMLSLYKKAK